MRPSIPAQRLKDFVGQDQENLAIEKDEHIKHVQNVDDLRLGTTNRANKLEKDNRKLAKQLQDLESSFKQKVKDITEGGKRSANNAIVQSRIKMASSAKVQGLDIWANELSDTQQSKEVESRKIAKGDKEEEENCASVGNPKASATKKGDENEA
ncbi:hypothetical protein E3N88_09234 [Mikania micrantha]|uniref:Uncharacterized protein n=1 Tax=Mikania micrantha TaxID=192012 RepID=A0A5N6PJE9_9ASTR|nr:hypothetical protein E3N88_09234 [Mikania micrantha]